MKKLLIPLLILIAFSSCNNYYKALVAPQPANANTITDLKTKDRFFILRNGSTAFTMNNISFSDNQKNVQCNLDVVPYEHSLRLNKGGDGKMKYSKTGEDQSAVLNEVHIYIAPDSNIVSGPYTLALDKVKKTEIIETDKAKTKRSHTLGLVLGITLPIVVVGGIAAIAISSSLANMSF